MTNTSGVLSLSLGSDTVTTDRSLYFSKDQFPQLNNQEVNEQFLGSTKLRYSMGQQIHLYSGFPDTSNSLINEDLKQ